MSEKEFSPSEEKSNKVDLIDQQEGKVSKIIQRGIQNRTKKLILLIENYKDMRELIKSHLENHGFDVISGNDGLEGQFLALKYDPDVIILDLLLTPKVDGLTLCQRLKKDERTSKIPILMINALVDFQDRIKGFNYPPDDCITKPFDLEELENLINKLLDKF